MDRGKYRSLAQRIGRKGEKLFAFWSEDRGLSCTKPDDDYGVDFWCQVLRPVGKRSLEEATGAILAVQVKATEGKARPRVNLDRHDAINLLRQTHATALVAVHPTANAVHFAFIDETMIDRLNQFLASEAKTHSIRLDELESNVAEFDRRLQYFTRPGTQHRLRVYKAERAICAAVPGSSMSVQHSATGGLAVVDVPWFGSALDVDPAAREAVRTQVFEKGRLPDELPGLSLKRAFLEAADIVDGPVFLQGMAQARAELALEHEGQRAEATFDLRRVGDERAYTHPVGLSVVISDARKHGKQWHHELQSRIFLGEQSLGAAREILPFLRLLRSGARLSFDGNALGPIESVGPAIVKVGPAVEALEKIGVLLNLDLSAFHLNDFRLEEFGYAVSFLDAVLLQKTPAERFVPAFLVGSAADGDPRQMPTEPVRVELPIVLNLKNRGVIVWVRARGTAFCTDDGRWCGLRIDEQLALSSETHAKFEKSVHPEVWISRYLPPLLIGAQNRGSRNVKLKASDYFIVEADIVKESRFEDRQTEGQQTEAACVNDAPTAE
ncbi:MAG: DUF4365 domain-containing protein [Acidobacteriales bacterium]|nr:DUF4365 domain-containing protein [Terriglobales bacterium]